MPKEKINNRDGEDIRVEVSWDRGGGVQVSTAVDDASNAAADAAAAGFVFRGFGCTLDATATDRLIKCLQKAREQAYGKPSAPVAGDDILNAKPGRVHVGAALRFAGLRGGLHPSDAVATVHASMAAFDSDAEDDRAAGHAVHGPFPTYRHVLSITDFRPSRAAKGIGVTDPGLPDNNVTWH